MPIRHLMLLVLAALSLVLAACGGGAATAPTAAPAPTEAAPAPTEAAPAPTEAAPAPTEAAPAPTEAAPAPTEAPAASAPQRFVIVPEESRVAYNVGETFLNQGNRYVVAVGVTNVLTGEVLFDPANPQNSSLGTITIDISQFASDSDRRDNAIRREWLESSNFPIAEFTVTQIDGLPATYTDGQEVTLQISGDLKVRDAVRPTTFETVGKIEGDTMTGKATTQVKMTDFGFEPPSILGILNAEDDVAIEFDFVARRAE
jgi:polyisoprenoid-binding protein YceI